MTCRLNLYFCRSQSQHHFLASIFGNEEKQHHDIFSTIFQVDLFIIQSIRNNSEFVASWNVVAMVLVVTGNDLSSSNVSVDLITIQIVT